MRTTRLGRPTLALYKVLLGNALHGKASLLGKVDLCPEGIAVQTELFFEFHTTFLLVEARGQACMDELMMIEFLNIILNFSR